MGARGDKRELASAESASSSQSNDARSINDKLRYWKKGRIAYLSLNRPRAINALDDELNRELWNAWRDFGEDPAMGTRQHAGCAPRCRLWHRRRHHPRPASYKRTDHRSDPWPRNWRGLRTRPGLRHPRRCRQCQIRCVRGTSWHLLGRWRFGSLDRYRRNGGGARSYSKRARGRRRGSAAPGTSDPRCSRGRIAGESAQAYAQMILGNCHSPSARPKRPSSISLGARSAMPYVWRQSTAIPVLVILGKCGRGWPSFSIRIDD